MKLQIPYFKLFVLICSMWITSCEDVSKLLQPEIIPTPTPPRSPTYDRDKELEEIGPPRMPNTEEGSGVIHPAVSEIKQLWEKTRTELENDILNYPQAFAYSARLDRASKIRSLWWDLNKKIVSSTDVDIVVLRTYAPFVDSVIQMIDSFYSVNTPQFGEKELAIAKTELRLMNDKVDNLK